VSGFVQKSVGNCRVLSGMTTLRHSERAFKPALHRTLCWARGENKGQVLPGHFDISFFYV
jgi:hypothetical protein